MLNAMDFASRYPIISDQITLTELRVILRELQKVMHEKVMGDVVELGRAIYSR